MKQELQRTENILQKYEQTELIKLIENERRERAKKLDAFREELQMELLKFENSLKSFFQPK
jgi:hypothetical protein